MKRFRKAAFIAGMAYCCLVLLRAALRLVFGDWGWTMAAASSFSIFLFAPLPAAIVCAAISRKRRLWAACGMVFLIGVWLHGRDFLPPRNRDSREPAVTVMTHNMWLHNRQAGAVEELIRDSGADVVCLQELPDALNDKLAAHLADVFPHQLLASAADVSGMGIFSRHPMVELTEEWNKDWVGRPQAVEMSVGGRKLTLVNVHVSPPGRGEYFRGRDIVRRSQAGELADYRRRHAGPVVIAGDLNAAPTNEIYSLLRGDLRDAWKTGGFGLGHTWPAMLSPERRRKLLRLPIPRMIRIDCVLHSSDFIALDCRVLPAAGSDHRAVVARLGLAAGK